MINISNLKFWKFSSINFLLELELHRKLSEFDFSYQVKYYLLLKGVLVPSYVLDISVHSAVITLQIIETSEYICTWTCFWHAYIRRLNEFLKICFIQIFKYEWGMNKNELMIRYLSSIMSKRTKQVILYL